MVHRMNKNLYVIFFTVTLLFFWQLCYAKKTDQHEEFLWHPNTL